MKLIMKRLLVPVAFSLLGASALKAQEQFLTSKVLEVTKHAVQKTEKPTPEELKKRLNPMSVELEKNKTTINEDLLNQLLKLAYLTSQGEQSPQVATLRQEIQGLNAAIEENNFDPNKLTHEQKMDVFNNLSLNSRMFIFEYMGDRLFAEKRPFDIPQNTKTLSQLDLFFVLTVVLTHDAGKQNPVWDDFHRSFISCVNAKEAWKITAQLKKNEYIPLLPMSIQNKLFSKSISVMFVIKERIKSLAVMYG